MKTERWQAMLGFAAGFWMFLSPWLLDYTHLTDAALSAWVIGVLVIAIAFWGLFDDADARRWLHDHVRHV